MDQRFIVLKEYKQKFIMRGVHTTMISVLIEYEIENMLSYYLSLLPKQIKVRYEIHEDCY